VRNYKGKETPEKLAYPPLCLGGQHHGAISVTECFVDKLISYLLTLRDAGIAVRISQTMVLNRSLIGTSKIQDFSWLHSPEKSGWIEQSRVWKDTCKRLHEYTLTKTEMPDKIVRNNLRL